MSQARKYNLAVVGANGMVGAEMLKILAERKFPIREIRAYGSGRGEKWAKFGEGQLEVQPLEESSFKDLNLVLMSAGEEVSRQWAMAGALVIDNSSAWRMEVGCPLVVPEVNGNMIASHKGVVANPNCCTIALSLALAPIQRRAGLKRVVVATYQSASGAGRPLVEELEEQTKAIIEGRETMAKVYPKQLAFNVVSGGWNEAEGGQNEEEVKIARETRKILGLPSLNMAVTCVRVPVKVGHGEAVFVETERAISVEEAKAALGAMEGVKVVEGEAPTPLDVAGSDDVLVGRVRQDSSVEHGLAMWVVSDNLRKGAALNAVQIAEWAAKRSLL